MFNKTGKFKNLKTLIAAGVTALAVSGVQAAEKRSFCVFDPVGANGPLFNLMKDSKTMALSMGVDLELRAYTDEKIAAEEFKAGQCDSVLLTGTRAREFNQFTGTLEAMGAINSNSGLRLVLQTLHSPKGAKFMKQGGYEVAGVLPAGAIYLFMRENDVADVKDLQGKKIATQDYDPAALTMVRHVGASVVPATSSTFAGKFNNGSVDIAYAPAVAYTPLELYKGLGDKGGVFNYKIAQMNFQILIHTDRMPEGFGQASREYAMSRFDEAFEIIKTAESEIKPNYWVEPISKEHVTGYDNMLRNVRLKLREDGVYNEKALKLMFKVRCKEDATRPECTERLE
jgi:hypothetical protein